MSAWLVLPSKRPPEEVEPILELWRKQGYRVAVQRDPSDVGVLHANIIFKRPYAGYAEAVNYLSGQVLMMEPDAEWIVCAGDDTQPDAAHSADEIRWDCNRYFMNLWHERPDCPDKGAIASRTFGVMQPTGDRWGDHQNTHTHTAHRDGSGRCNQCGHPKDHNRHQHGAYIDRVAGSPWMGREFCLRVNQGRGPLWPEYFHMGCDEELQAVATRLGVFWQRPDLIHLHKHWGRGEGGKMVDANTMPDFLKRANSLEEWQRYKALFAQREAAGFPGSEPLALQKEDQ